ncbi:unnamed protein product [Miscanthus lutarioriparius]|uniref:Uncharacterized protein n=1 Tax=Miscanthus lutarioriparius TaxID=422564 RepID=A0A811RZS6_9POAL|nr:unnamed protein product [Miscanthus lutarioriparius]
MTVETGSHWQAEVDWAWVDTAAAANADDDHPHVVVSRIKEGTRKRLYEHGEGELDREMDKMYKRDYWERGPGLRAPAGALRPAPRARRGHRVLQ